PVFASVGPVAGQTAEVPNYHDTEPDRESPSVAEPVFEPVPAVEQTAEILSPGKIQTTEPAEVPAIVDLTATSAGPVEAPSELSAVVEEAVTPTVERAIDFEPIGQGQPIPYQLPVSALEPSVAEAVTEAPSSLSNAISNKPVSSRS